MLFPPVFKTTDKGHGRIETREIQVTTQFLKASFPYAQQVGRIHRTRIFKDGKKEEERVLVISSRKLEDMSPEQMLAYNRRHWGIENKLHYPRDVSQDEDRRYGKKNPAMFVALRNIAISLVKLVGIPFLPSGNRYFSANQTALFRVLGISP